MQISLSNHYIIIFFYLKTEINFEKNQILISFVNISFYLDFNLFLIVFENLIKIKKKLVYSTQKSYNFKINKQHVIIVLYHNKILLLQILINSQVFLAILNFFLILIFRKTKN